MQHSQQIKDDHFTLRNHSSWKLKIEGFTLIEVLVSLTVIAIALTAITQAAFSFRKSANYLQQKTIAGWVAQNIYNEYSLGIRPTPSTLIDEQGEQTQLNHQWSWTIRFQRIEDSPIIKTDILVMPNHSDETAAHLSGYLSKP